MDIENLELSYEESAVDGKQAAAEINALMDRLENIPTPPTLWSFGFEADDLLAVYAALRTYLRALASQDDEDLEMLARIVKLLRQIRPGAVKASKLLALKVTEVRDAK